MSAAGAGAHGPSATRAKISVTVSADLLSAVDEYVRVHSDVDRSRVVDEALLLWYAREQDRAVRAQFEAPQSAEELAERADWDLIQREAARCLFRDEG